MVIGSPEKPSMLKRLAAELDDEIRSAGYDPSILSERELFLKLKNNKLTVANSPLDSPTLQRQAADVTPLVPSKGEVKRVAG